MVTYSFVTYGRSLYIYIQFRQGRLFLVFCIFLYSCMFILEDSVYTGSLVTYEGSLYICSFVRGSVSDIVLISVIGHVHTGEQCIHV